MNPAVFIMPMRRKCQVVPDRVNGWLTQCSEQGDQLIFTGALFETDDSERAFISVHYIVRERICNGGDLTDLIPIVESITE